MRHDKRQVNTLRKIQVKPHFIKSATGSCLIEFGSTRVVCTASVENEVPRFLKGKGQGWVTAEYGMIPASTPDRIQRESSRGKVGGRTQEIQRLIGRSLRSIVDMKKLGERTVWIDCDVIQADGGTRTASITGGFIALGLAIQALQKRKELTEQPILDYIAAVSVGIVEGRPMLDLAYVEDSQADVDMNVVMTGRGKFVEVQGTAERDPFSAQDLNKLLTLAQKGITELIRIQKRFVTL
jgi:ribonuclease PH